MTTWFQGPCGGPRVGVDSDGSFIVEGSGRPAHPVNAAVDSFEASIRRWASEYGVPAHVVAGVMMRESRGIQSILGHDPGGSVGVGLMQLTSAGAKEGHSTEELVANADLNIQLGVKLLGFFWRKYGGDPIRSLTSYNAGSPRCRDGANPWNLVNTSDYVGGVLALANGALDGAFKPKTAVASMLGPGALLLALGGLGGWYAFDWLKRSTFRGVFC